MKFLKVNPGHYINVNYLKTVKVTMGPDARTFCIKLICTEGETITLTQAVYDSLSSAEAAVEELVAYCEN